MVGAGLGIKQAGVAEGSDKTRPYREVKAGLITSIAGASAVFVNLGRCFLRELACLDGDLIKGSGEHPDSTIGSFIGFAILSGYRVYMIFGVKVQP